MPRDPRREVLKSMVVRACSAIKSTESMRRAAQLAQQSGLNPALVDRLIGSDRAANETALAAVAVGAYGNGSAEFMSLGAVAAACGPAFAAYAFTSAALVVYFRECLRLSGKDPAQFGRHAWATSAAAATLARWKGMDADQARLAGLLHNVGLGVMVWSDSEKYGRGSSPLAGTEAQVHEMESELFGFDHQEAGALCLKHCGFPNDLGDVAATHHSATVEGLAGIVRTADIAAHQMGCDLGFANSLPASAQVKFESIGEEKLAELAGVVSAAMTNFNRLRV